MAAIALIVSAADGRAVGGAQALDAVRALHAQDVAIETIGYRLASANRNICPTAAIDPGFAVHTLGQYASAYRDAAAQAFGLTDRPAILAVAPGSPAERAGLREGDAILAIDGTMLNAGQPGRRADYGATAAALSVIRAGFADGVAMLDIRRGGHPLRITVRGEKICRSLFQVVTDDAMNGAADGDYVQVSSDLMALAANPDELAALLAHELAHNILGHRLRLDSLKVSRGLLASFGRNARLIRQTEIEADRLSVYLLARAGYDSDKGVAIWDRLARRIGRSDATHPNWPERLRLMAVERARLKEDPNAALPDDLSAAIAAAR